MALATLSHALSATLDLIMKTTYQFIGTIKAYMVTTSKSSDLYCMS